jgi:hypothetical protein
MRASPIRRCSKILALALLLTAPQAFAMDAAAIPAAAADAFAQAASPQAIAEYKRRLQEYLEARAAFEQEAGAYWSSISEKRRGRNAKRRDRQQITLDDYVLTQPPVYDGPKRPVDPSPEPERPPRERKTIPLVADLLKAANEHFQFAPQRPANELEFKRAYARVASAAGLTREQAVRVYSFETGGNGNHDMQSGLSVSRPGSRAISTAIGYNQLLTTNSVELVAEQGNDILKALTEKAARLSGPPRKAMDHKIAVFKRMMAFTRSVPDEWAAHEKLADTPQGLRPPADRGRTGDDESHRRRHRARHGDHAAGDARTGPDLEFLPALWLRAQSGCGPQQHRSEAFGDHRRADGQQFQ